MKTLKVRIKDKHSKVLEQMAREVNFVWNYVNDLSFKHLQRTGKFFSSYDLHPYTTGATKEGMMSLHSQTLQAVNDEYTIRRKQFKKAKLRWRVSYGSRKSLGWIPFKTGNISYRNGQLKYNGNYFSLWDSYDLSKYKMRSGSFSQDSRGRWYANLCVKVIKTEKKPIISTKSIGIDLGLKDFLVTSNGLKIEALRIYRSYEDKLKVVQRANKKSRVRAIHVKIRNIRNDFHHKLSNKLVKENSAIFVGDVSSSKLSKTKMAKSVLDAGWSSFRTMLKYKSDYAGVWFEEVNEKYTTQTCSDCGCLPDSRPKGIAGLVIREWSCNECGVTHDRDINAAKNILAAGHCRLAGGILIS